MKIVATSGGFDPLHIGHIRCFKEAKALGDWLIVVLNSDRFLIQKKGFVFMPFKERKELIASIKYVDEVVNCIDKDQSVCETLTKIRPAVFAKGGDRTLENIPEAKICQRLGIKMIFNVGGKKVQSSSWLLKKFAEVVKSK
jgi:D-beta-D-heptose 7-phosphate kinase/D-beta-D-heptose 1-phosphate adenosyltransferase